MIAQWHTFLGLKFFNPYNIVFTVLNIDAVKNKRLGQLFIKYPLSDGKSDTL